MPAEATRQEIIDEWFEAIDCDDEEFVGTMLGDDRTLLDTTFNEAEYDEELAELASDLLGKDVGPLTPLQYACFVESEDSALVLADACTEGQLNHKWGANNNTLLHLVAFNGLESVLRKLLKRGLPPNIKNKLGFRPMDCVANDATRDVFANFRDEDEGEDVPASIESKPKVCEIEIEKENSWCRFQWTAQRFFLFYVILSHLFFFLSFSLENGGQNRTAEDSPQGDRQHQLRVN